MRRFEACRGREKRAAGRSILRAKAAEAARHRDAARPPNRHSLDASRSRARLQTAKPPGH